MDGMTVTREPGNPKKILTGPHVISYIPCHYVTMSAQALQHGLKLGHGLQLKGDPFQPVVGCLHHARHLGHLPTNHWVLDQGLPKGLALSGELQGLLQADSGEAGAHGAKGEALVVEVLHHVLEALALFAQQIA